ncbi:MAG TPA: hypothetical protein VL354_16535, partial [Spirochaetia bacterium]|nr:hypothetical protein [Spirochaetia bacterium]
VFSFVSVVARPIVYFDAGGFFDVGGRLELQLRSPIYLNLARVYVGFGPQAFYEASGGASGQTDFSGGWEIGLEVFLAPQVSARWEMGTSGGGVVYGAGPSLSVGLRVYPWAVSP